ncbi:extracellular solute-binding protein [Rhizobium sp. PP-F2F-G48]|uniref:ABC transporter substrate-binding protein n=1 Tax=Rhizobium sp. PP-F2F-G48 TaxID=2135651 RepID=UPI0010475AA0|nr:extracellular solute-binding protein [Rhizobium sp. PP-F2F-G48]
MTWNHPRGYDPLVACARLWQEQTGVAVTWDKRSLQDFETYPVEELARAYDLIVIDHPHVGQITRENCLAPLDVPEKVAEAEALRAGSVGASFPSYNWQGRQWALPIDAATQVQAFRPDLLSAPPQRWEEMLDLARRGLVLLPLRPPHSLMSFYTLAANLGTPCAVEGGQLIVPEAGVAAFEALRELAALVPEKCFEMDPIAVLEAMADTRSAHALSPLIYGYVSYAMKGFREKPIHFHDIPSAGHEGPVGSAIGGTGIAVSAFSTSPEEALDFAYWIASGDVQKGHYAASSGQPGHAAAWEDETVNAATADFYHATRATLEAAWVRPRHDGYMPFQQAASETINRGLLERRPAPAVVAELNRLFRDSFKAR